MVPRSHCCRFAAPRALLALLLPLAACTPLTAYRQTAFVPASTPPAHFGAPLPADTVAASAAVAGFGVTEPMTALLGVTDLESGLDAAERFFPVEGDPGVAHPALALEGGARIGIKDLLELGAHGSYSAHAWSSRGYGVLEIPGDGPLWGLGGHVTLGKRWGWVGLGGTLDGTVWSVPYARWAYDGPAEYAGGYALGEAVEWYALEEQGRVGVLRVSGTVGTSFHVGLFDSALGLAFVPDINNRGFTNSPVPPVEWGGLSLVPTVDLGLLIAPVRVGVQSWYATGAPAATNRLATGLGVRGQVEVRGKLKRP